MNCIFCKIVKGELPSYKVYDDDQFLAFLDINPLTKGHSLIVSREHYRWTYDVPEFGEYFEVAKKVGIAAKEALNADWICFLTIGLDVAHAHIHVIPRYKNDLHDAVIDLKRMEKISEDRMREIAEKIKQALLKNEA